MPMNEFDKKTPNAEMSDHDMMLKEVYQDDVELLYLDCCFSELLS